MSQKRKNTSMYYQLNIENLQLEVHLGWPEAERQNLQRVLINVTLQFSGLPKAAQSDDLADTVCYAEIADKLKRFNGKTFKLIEHLGHECFEMIRALAKDAQKIEINVRKFLSEAEGARSFNLVVEL